jgi:protein SCO1/2
MKTRLLIAALFLAGLAAVPSAAQSLKPAQAAGAGKTEETPAHKYFTDVLLINQDGQQMRLYSDLLKGKVVIINTFFTTCTSMCPPMSRNLEKVQTWLGDRLGKDVYIISFSVDPETDTPPRLKHYSKGYNARPGWYFITGKKENLEFALYKLGQKVADKNDHTSVMIIGNDSTGLWKKAFGLAPADGLIKVVESVLNDKGGEK